MYGGGGMGMSRYGGGAYGGGLGMSSYGGGAYGGGAYGSDNLVREPGPR